jgi:hypothetical protein
VTTSRKQVRAQYLVAIGEHIIAKDALSSGNKGVGIGEPPHLWIVITGLEIVERGLGVLGLSPMYLPRNL